MSKHKHVKHIEKRVKEIARIAREGDDERAFGLEIDLYMEVLGDISSGSGVDAEIAQAALKASELDYQRNTA